MHRLLILIAATLISTSAFAVEFNWRKAAEEYYEIRGKCRVGDGLSVKESDEACRQLDTLGMMLRMHDLCWEKGEQEWVVCPPKP